MQWRIKHIGAGGLIMTTMLEFPSTDITHVATEFINAHRESWVFAIEAVPPPAEDAHQNGGYCDDNA